MSRFFVMVKRELRSITKEKTIVLALIIQLFIASFSSIILLGIMSFYAPDTIGQNTRVTIKVGIVGDTASPLTGFLKERRLRVWSFDSAADAERAFRYGVVDTIMFVPEGDSGTVDIKLILPDSDARATVILMVLKEPLKKYETYLRETNGVELIYKDLPGKPPSTYEFLYSVIITILMFFPALVAGSIVIDTISEEIENKTLDTLRSAPVSLNQVVGAKILAAVITVLIQCVMWAMLLRLNDLYINNLGLVLLFSVIVGASVAIGAAVISLYFKDRERSQFVYTIVLIGMAGLSYLLSPSPFSLVAGLAAGSHSVGLGDVALYMIPLSLLSVVFFTTSTRLLSTQS